MAREVDLAWDHGFIHLEANDELSVEAANTRIELSQREVRVKGLYSGLQEYNIDRRGQKKIIYIILAFKIAPLTGTPRSLVIETADLALGRFGVAYTVLDGVERYVTIYTPPGFLYDHAIISSDRIALSTLGRRQVYVMEEDGVRRVMLV